MDDYKALIKSLRWLANMFPEMHPAEDDADRMFNNIHLYCKAAADAIEKLQADVRPVVHGKWVFDCERTASDGWEYRQYHCSLCGLKTYGGTLNFCPSCGADMREETC